MHKTLGLAALSALAIAGAASAQAPNWNGAYQEPPRGSYFQSCREITAFNGEVHARCKTSRGGWAYVSAYVRDCNSQGMANGDGKLICQSLAGSNNGGWNNGGWNGGGGGQGGNGGGWNNGGGNNGGGWNNGGGGRPGGGNRDGITIYEDTQYQGRSYDVVGDMPDLGAIKFNDKASSISIGRNNGGKWEICEHANYQGRCSRLDADQAILPREWNDAISSIRRVR
jgi:hypothetical protein